jgi:hypothetical protein
MKTYISEVAEVQTGATLREKPYVAANGDSVLLQLGDVGVEGIIQFESLSPMSIQAQYDHFEVPCGDLVFRGRGAAIAVAVIPALTKRVIAAAPLIIIRPNGCKVDSCYLAWALTTNDAHRHYAQLAQGSAIVGIGKNDLETLKINLPDLPTQRKIGELKSLQTKEKDLLARHHMARMKLINAITSDYADSTQKEKRT